MNGQAIDIERIVREVIAALTASPTVAPALPATPVELRSPQKNGGPTASVPSPSIPTKTPAAEPAASDTLVFTQNIVTMNDVAGRLQAIRRLVVPRKAVVTPAVQDELLRRNIELAWGNASKSAETAKPRLAMICSGADFDPASLIAVLGREGVKVEASALDCLISSTEQLAAELATSNTMALLLTRHTAAALCLANRLPGVRAVTGSDVPSIAAAVAAVGANLLVLNPRACSFFQVKQIVSEFCRGGVRPCPEVFAQHLN